jgi:predicted permease
MLAELFSIIAPLFVCAGIGYGWAKTGRGFDVEMVTNLVTNIGVPCLVFHTLTNLKVPASSFGTMAVAAVAVIAVCLVVGGLILHLAGLPRRAYLPALVFANTGNMGLPLTYLAFGDVGLGLAIAVFTVYATTQFTLGMALASGTTSFRSLLRIPVLYALPPALAFMLTGATPPKWIDNTTDILGGIVIPMMLITLGISLAKLAVKSLPRSLGLSLLRLGMGFAVGIGISYALGLEGASRGVLIIQSSMPVAVFNYLFAMRYKTAPAEVAGMVVISTVLSFATLPLLLWFVL